MRKASGVTSPRKLSRGRTVVLQSTDESGAFKDNSLRITPSHNHSLPHEASKSLPPTAKEGNIEILEPVANAFKDLDHIVNNLNSNIVDIVKKQNKGFIQTYKHDIIYRRRGLQALHNKYQESIAQVNKDERVLELENEAQFLREEAMKVTKLLEERDNQIKVLKTQVSNLKDENNVLAGYVKYKLKKNFTEKIELEQQSFEPPHLFKPRHTRAHSSKGRERYSKENMNKTFLTTNSGKADLSRTFMTFEVEETDMDLPPPRTKMEEVDRFIDSLEEKSFNNKLSFLRETEKFCKELVSFYEKKLQEKQKKFSKEKIKMESVTNLKLGENKELYDFYNQCIDDVRRNIAQRKVATRTSLRSSMNKTRQGFDLKEELKNTSYEDFLLKDKQKVLELFVSHPQVLEIIKSNVFSLKEKSEPNNRIRNSIMSRFQQALTMDANSTLFSMHDKTSENISNENSFYHDTRTSHGLSLPKTPGGILLDFSKLPKTAETDSETLVTDHPTTEPGIINIKFAQLFDSKGVPAFQPKDRALMRNITHSYKI